MTPFESMCIILGDLWLNYKYDEEFEDFIGYNDLGLPLAYMISEDITKPNELGVKYVEETWLLFLASLEIDDTGFSSLQEIFSTIKRDF
jgi:hypothetical protein